MLPDESLHVLGLMAWGMIDEEDYLLRSMPLRVADQVRQMVLELSAFPLLVGVEDEPVVPLRPEECDEGIPPLVVARSRYPPLLPSLHPFSFNLWVEGCPGLVLERYKNPFFSNAGATCL